VRFNIISNISNGVGLQRDYELLRRLLELHGSQVSGVDFRAPSAPRADVNIFLEVVTPAMLGAARESWIVPNSEWWHSRWDSSMPAIRRVLCKTRDCLKIWSQKAPGKATYIGWEAEDIYRPEVERKNAFLHMVGKSQTKGTAAVIEAWEKFKLPYPLTVVSARTGARVVGNVRYLPWMPREDAIKTINEHRFFLMPSEYEGFGQSLYEAAGCGGIILTTNAAPMNEIPALIPECQISVSSQGQMKAANISRVSTDGVVKAVHAAAALSQDEISKHSDAARNGFLASRELFRKRLYMILEGIGA